MKCEPIYLARAELAEGPVWHEGALWWVDIQDGTLNRLEISSGLNTARAVGEMIGAAAPCETPDKWVVALQTGFGLLTWRTGALERLGNPEQDRPENRFNDGKCDPAGRFWAGTLHFKGTPEQAGLYVLEPNLTMRCALAPVSLANGLAWSRNGETMYFVDTIPRKIWAFDYNLEAGSICNQRLLLQVPSEMGHPDGMCIDANDNLWVALWGGGAVVCVDGRKGKILDRISVPARQTSSCCFGGENLDELFITSAWQNFSHQQRKEDPLAGCLFRVVPGVKGRPASLFRH